MDRTIKPWDQTGADARSCGGDGQRPCALLTWDFFDVGGFCEPGLDHVPFTVCTSPVDSEEVVVESSLELGLIAGEIYLAFANPDYVDTIWALLDSLDDTDPVAIQRALERDQRIDRVYALMRELGFESMTVGLASGSALLWGGGLEGGVVLDPHQRDPAYLYDASYTSFGLQLNAGGDIVVSGFLPRSAGIGGTATGSAAYADVGPGAGITVWLDDGGHFIGFSVPVGIGGLGGGLAGVTANTTVRGAVCPPPPASVEPPPSQPEPGPVVLTVATGDTLWGPWLRRIWAIRSAFRTSMRATRRRSPIRT